MKLCFCLPSLSFISDPDFFQIHGTENQSAPVPPHTHQCPDILVLSLYCIIVLKLPCTHCADQVRCAQRSGVSFAGGIPRAHSSKIPLTALWSYAAASFRSSLERMIFSDRLARKHWSSLTPIAGCSSSRAFSRPLEMHSSSVNSAAVPLRRNTLWERQFSPRKLPGVRYAISSGAEQLFASRLATAAVCP